MACRSRYRLVPNGLRNYFGPRKSRLLVGGFRHLVAFPVRKVGRIRVDRTVPRDIGLASVVDHQGSLCGDDVEYVKIMGVTTFGWPGWMGRRITALQNSISMEA